MLEHFDVLRGHRIVIDAKKILRKIIEVRNWIIGKRDPFDIV